MTAITHDFGIMAASSHWLRSSPPKLGIHYLEYSNTHGLQGWPYDWTHAFVISAPTETAARALAMEQDGRQGRWDDPAMTDCLRIGTVDDANQEARVFAEHEVRG